MQQNSLIPIKILQQTPANLETADLKFIGVADDSHQYALKCMSEHRFLPITEWVGYHLCRSIGLATPDFAVVWLDDDTPAFGSRLEEVQQLGMPPNPMQIVQYLGPNMRSVTEPIFAIDAFLPNEDRHARNFMWRTSAVGVIPLAFDYSRAWLIGGVPFGEFPLNANHATIQMWSYLKSAFSYAAPIAAMHKISALPDDWLESVIKLAPAQWIADFDISPTMEFWRFQRKARCESALTIL
ncbi:MAG: hypothetical protein IPQ12_11905 [Polaromonas sp.]|nr:hypothetical protein [Polaromonas sp.]